MSRVYPPNSQTPSPFPQTYTGPTVYPNDKLVIISDVDPGEVINDSLWVDTSQVPPVMYIRVTGGWTQLGAAAPTVPDLFLVLSAGDDAGGLLIENLQDPVSAQDAATKAYVDANAGGGSVTPAVQQTPVRSVIAGDGNINITAAPDGSRIIVGIVDYGGVIDSLTSTNTTWTRMGVEFDTGVGHMSIWVGVVAGGATGTTIAVAETGGGTVIALTVVVLDALTPTLIAQATLDTGAYFAPLPAFNHTPGAFFAFLAMTDNTSSPVMALPSVPYAGIPVATQATGLAIGYLPDGDMIPMIMSNGSSTGGGMVVAIS